MSRFYKLVLAALVCFVLWFSSVRPAFAFDGWLPIPPEDLAMTSYPKAPGAAAIVLFRKVDRDDAGRAPHEFHYERIKILTEEGRKYADVEIPFDRLEVALNMSGLHGRTIHPDGSVVEFDGKVFDKTVVKTRDYQYTARTFTLPDVHAGSIIEYQFNLDLNENLIFSSRWTLSSELYTRDAKFSLKPYPEFGVRWSWPAGLPDGTAPPKIDSLSRAISMETHNIPALPFEEFMSPREVLTMRVEFSYDSSGGLESDPAKFWRAFGKKRNGAFESFIGRRNEVQAELGTLLSPSDSPEAKARKIYTRVQLLRNTSYERGKTEQEVKRNKEKTVKNAGDVLKQGFGDSQQIDWLFVAMARSAGLDAVPLVLAARSRIALNQTLLNSNQLDDDAIRLKLDGKEIYLDPGCKFVPFGVLCWPDTGVGGLALDRDGGSWILTPLPSSSENTITRKADLKLTTEGTLEGVLTVTYGGLEALQLRQGQREADATARTKFAEDLVHEAIPVGVEVSLTNKPEWSSSAPQLTMEYTLRVPGWAAGTGHRALVGLALFGESEKHMFERADRVTNVYFHFNSRKDDDVTLALPLGWKVATTPLPINQDSKAVGYMLKAEGSNGTLHLTRTLRTDLFILDVKNYGALRQFFEVVRTGDEQQAVLQPGS